jgi:hypothetical protein
LSLEERSLTKRRTRELMTPPAENDLPVVPNLLGETHFGQDKVKC